MGLSLAENDRERQVARERQKKITKNKNKMIEKSSGVFGLSFVVVNYKPYTQSFSNK